MTVSPVRMARRPAFNLLCVVSLALVIPAAGNYIESPAHRHVAKSLEPTLRHRNAGDGIPQNNTAHTKVSKSSEGSQETKKGISRRLFAADEESHSKSDLRGMKIPSKNAKGNSTSVSMGVNEPGPERVVASTSELVHKVAPPKQDLGLSVAAPKPRKLNMKEFLAKQLAPVLVWMKLIWTKMKASATMSLLYSKLPGLAKQIVPSTPIRSALP
eukprot:2550567-Rhodomonas_salina.3